MKQEQLIEVWISKYALTQGIIKTIGRVCDTDPSGGMIEVRRDKSIFKEYYYGKNWYRTEEAACAKAEEMRLAKIKSLEKSLFKMRAKCFKYYEGEES